MSFVNEKLVNAPAAGSARRESILGAVSEESSLSFDGGLPSSSLDRRCNTPVSSSSVSGVLTRTAKRKRDEAAGMDMAMGASIANDGTPDHSSLGEFILPTEGVFAVGLASQKTPQGRRRSARLSSKWSRTPVSIKTIEGQSTLFSPAPRRISTSTVDLKGLALTPFKPLLDLDRENDSCSSQVTGQNGLKGLKEESSSAFHERESRDSMTQGQAKAAIIAEAEGESTTLKLAPVEEKGLDPEPEPEPVPVPVPESELGSERLGELARFAAENPSTKDEGLEAGAGEKMTGKKLELGTSTTDQVTEESSVAPSIDGATSNEQCLGSSMPTPPTNSAMTRRKKRKMWGGAVVPSFRRVEGDKANEAGEEAAASLGGELNKPFGSKTKASKAETDRVRRLTLASGDTPSFFSPSRVVAVSRKLRTTTTRRHTLMPCARNGTSTSSLRRESMGIKLFQSTTTKPSRRQLRAKGASTTTTNTKLTSNLNNNGSGDVPGYLRATTSSSSRSTRRSVRQKLGGECGLTQPTPTTTTPKQGKENCIGPNKPTTFSTVQQKAFEPATTAFAVGVHRIERSSRSVRRKKSKSGFSSTTKSSANTGCKSDNLPGYLRSTNSSRSSSRSKFNRTAT